MKYVCSGWFLFQIERIKRIERTDKDQGKVKYTDRCSLGVRAMSESSTCMEMNKYRNHVTDIFTCYEVRRVNNGGCCA